MANAGIPGYGNSVDTLIALVALEPLFRPRHGVLFVLADLLVLDQGAGRREFGRRSHASIMP